jgi:hypothetical protein
VMPRSATYRMIRSAWHSLPDGVRRPLLPMARRLYELVF